MKIMISRITIYPRLMVTYIRRGQIQDTGKVWRVSGSY